LHLMDEHSHLGDACTIQIRNTEWDGMECVERRNDTRLSICVGDLFRVVKSLRSSTSTRIRLGQSRSKTEGRSNKCQTLGEHVVV
jgi:hypothetical protein